MRQEWIGKRKAIRQSCSIRAEIRPLDGRPVLECTITDISNTGARIEAANLEDVPESFDLFIPARNEMKFARISRREAGFVGAEFLKSRGDDPQIIGDLLQRLVRLEQVFGFVPKDPETTKPRGAKAAVLALEARLAKLETETEVLRGLAEAAVDVPHLSTPDRLPEIQSLTGTLAALADRLDELRAQPPAVGRDEFGALAATVQGLAEALASARDAAQEAPGLWSEVTALRDELNLLKAQMHTSAQEVEIEILRQEMAQMRAMLAALAQAAPAASASPAVAAVEAAPEIKAEVADLRSAVQTLILLVSQSVAERNAA
jgi:hypothetical protein